MTNPKKFSSFQDFVYSTNPNYKPENTSPEKENALPVQQDLRVWLETKHRGGKSATVIKGFCGTQDELELLAKKLKTNCGTGGSAKDGEIIIQGDFRDKVVEILHSLHFKAKKAGG